MPNQRIPILSPPVTGRREGISVSGVAFGVVGDALGPGWVAVGTGEVGELVTITRGVSVEVAGAVAVAVGVRVGVRLGTP